jgi:N-acetylneuraminic acid mutarotase
MMAPFLLLLVLTLVDAHLNFTSVIVANWTEVADGPSGRECLAIAPLSDGRLLMYGGNTQRKDGLYKFFNDTYIYTPSSFTSSNGKGVTSAGAGTWTKVADGPGARHAHAMAPLSNGRVLMYGGGKMVNETYQITEILNDAYI